MIGHYVERSYRVHVVDIRDLVDYFENSVEHLINEYILSHNDTNKLFDYCIHMAMCLIVKYNLSYNGKQIHSNYIDYDLFDTVFKYNLGENFVNSLYSKLKTYNILVNDIHLNLNLRAFNYQQQKDKVIKLTVVGNALWIFEGAG